MKGYKDGYINRSMTLIEADAVVLDIKSGTIASQVLEIETRARGPDEIRKKLVKAYKDRYIIIKITDIRKYKVIYTLSEEDFRKYAKKQILKGD